MNLLDYVLIVILGYCLVRGVFRGLIKELSSIVGVLGGFYAAYSYYPQLAKHLARWIANPAWLSISSFLAIFVVVLFSVSFAGVVIKYLMNIAFLGWTDRICGAIFGSARGLLMITVILLVLTTFLPKNSVVIKQSWVAQHMMQYSAWMVYVTPKEMKKSFDIKAKEINKSWQHP
jgi:membrane protein required for colicin V production